MIGGKRAYMSMLQRGNPSSDTVCMASVRRRSKIKYMLAGLFNYNLSSVAKYRSEKSSGVLKAIPPNWRA